ncbi:class I SAM-dependent methyltransferase [Mesorhizobium sp. M0025]|uniref:class I SAM-dependent methyltransferase n=1 Tax=Mesorhizobium sp. M0025 TaxID=2956846 RepID=UPI0033398165
MFETEARARRRLSELAFMSPRDIGLFLRSARTDAVIMQERQRLGNASAFDAAYARGDPWASGDPRYLYQRRKYDALLRLLPDERYGRVLDLGAGVGHFTRRLASRSDDVVGVDIAQSAVDQARQLHADIPNLEFLRGDILALPELLDGGFDLVVIADTIYYLPPPIEDWMLKAVATRTARLLRPGGLLLLCNHFFFLPTATAD